MSCIKGFETINSNKEFNKIYKKPSECWHTKEFVLFYAKSDSKQVAFVASKKVGNAIYRNKAKRVLRATFVIYADSLKNGSYIYVAKKDIINTNFQIINKNFKYIIKRLNLARQKA